MTYKINGVALSLQPTTGKWVNRREMGITPDGHAVYAAIREFELSWDLISASDFAQLVTFFNAVGITGSVVASLPQYGASAWQFYDYSGCIAREPEQGVYFNEYTTSAKMLIVRIHT